MDRDNQDTLKSINNHLKSCSEKNNVYTYSFTLEEVEIINKALEKKSWLEEVKQLLQEAEDMDKVTKRWMEHAVVHYKRCLFDVIEDGWKEGNDEWNAALVYVAEVMAHDVVEKQQEGGRWSD